MRSMSYLVGGFRNALSHFTMPLGSLNVHFPAQSGSGTAFIGTHQMPDFMVGAQTHATLVEFRTMGYELWQGCRGAGNPYPRSFFLSDEDAIAPGDALRNWDMRLEWDGLLHGSENVSGLGFSSQVNEIRIPQGGITTLMQDGARTLFPAGDVFRPDMQKTQLRHDIDVEYYPEFEYEVLKLSEWRSAFTWNRFFTYFVNRRREGYAMRVMLHGPASLLLAIDNLDVAIPHGKWSAEKMAEIAGKIILYAGYDAFSRGEYYENDRIATEDHVEKFTVRSNLTISGEPEMRISVFKIHDMTDPIRCGWHAFVTFCVPFTAGDRVDDLAFGGIIAGLTRHAVVPVGA